jgi:uncharacterized protein (TIGR03790 family)
VRLAPLILLGSSLVMVRCGGSHARGAADAGPSDASIRSSHDAGIDAAATLDASAQPDASADLDAAPMSDAEVDASTSLDATPPDATAPDSAPPADASSPDATTGPGSPGPERVLIVYNASWPNDDDQDGVQDSLEVASYYASARGVPSTNMIGLSLTTGTDVSTLGYATFQSAIVQPIQAKLAALGPESIDVLLMIYGVPMAVADAQNNSVSIDNALMVLDYWDAANDTLSWLFNPYFEPTPGFPPDVGHFDHASYTFSNHAVYLVTRLDGPRGPSGAMDLVDQSLYAERYLFPQGGSYQGTVYVDARFGPYTDAMLSSNSDVVSGNYNSYASADVNMAYAEHYVGSSGFPLKWETTGANIGAMGAMFTDGTTATSAPNAFLYGGWYNYNNYNDAWGWLPGSVACDLDSDSLYYWHVRASPPASFGPSALYRGASAVSGVVGEPYVNGHPRPNILLYYLLNGFSFAEASALSTPSIGWMPIHIGDPLYAPMRPKPMALDSTAPALQGSQAVSVSAGSATIRFTVANTPEPEVAMARVAYGLTTTYGSTVSSGEGYWRRHALTIGGLAAASTYHYAITLTDPSGNTSTTGDATFQTP